jgi:predicted metal-dependent hydrolase
VKGRASSVTFGTTKIAYSVRRTERRKTVSIAIGPDGDVEVAAPHGVDDERIRRIVLSKARWVLGRVRESERPPSPSAREMVSGETFVYAGRQHRLRVRTGEADRVALLHGHLEVVVRGTPTADRVRALLVGWYRGRANERLGELAKVWTERTGCRPQRLVIVEQARRWGSCSPSGEVRLNWRIVGATRRLAEYVVAHELTHLAHPEHGPAFWRALGKAMPDYEERRAALREVGPRLMW